MPTRKEMADGKPAVTAAAHTDLRIVVVSTPRSGNTWLRHLLAKAYGATEVAVHNPAEVDWETLPSCCVLQIHWHPTPKFLALLTKHGFRVVVLARHPLDVLLSILHYALYDASTLRWLEGEGGAEDCIRGAMPTSAAFLAYATGPRATALLSVTHQWWSLPSACLVHYEALVADPLRELTQLAHSLGASPCAPLPDVIVANAFGQLRSKSGTTKIPESAHHYWQGKPGHWKRLLPADVSQAIWAAHMDCFHDLQYLCDADHTLDRAQADASWIELNRQELTERLWNYAPTKQKLAYATTQVAALEQQQVSLKAVFENRQLEMMAEFQKERDYLVSALADAAEALKWFSQTPTRRLALLVKRLLRVPDRQTARRPDYPFDSFSDRRHLTIER